MQLNNIGNGSDQKVEEGEEGPSQSQWLFSHYRVLACSAAVCHAAAEDCHAASNTFPVNTISHGKGVEKQEDIIHI